MLQGVDRGCELQVEEEVPEAGYAASYARLVNSGREPSDPLPGVIPKEELSKLVNQFQQVALCLAPLAIRNVR